MGTCGSHIHDTRCSGYHGRSGGAVNFLYFCKSVLAEISINRNPKHEALPWMDAGSVKSRHT
jgi:hypothetical protein